MGIKKYDIDPADTVVAGLADSNTSAGATVVLDGTLTSGGTFTSADSLAHRLILTDGTAHVQTTATYTITGTDSDGNTLVEAIAGPGSGGNVKRLSIFSLLLPLLLHHPLQVLLLILALLMNLFHL